jgi:hypothetical protein
MNDAVASAVRRGYEIVEQNIKEGRQAAQKFRDGELSSHEASENTREMLLRVVDLSQQATFAWFGLLNHLLAKKTTPAVEPEVEEKVADWPPLYGRPPVFYATPAPLKPRLAPRLEVAFSGSKTAKMLVARLSRTDAPLNASNGQITLKEYAGDRHITDAISQDVTFDTTAAGDAVKAHLAIKANAEPGTYSAKICQTVPGQGEVEIGLLSIEVGQRT